MIKTRNCLVAEHLILEYLDQEKEVTNRKNAYDNLNIHVDENDFT